MSETINSRNVRDDEIDLLDLFKRFGNVMGRMFRALGKWILISIVFLLRHWLALGLSIVLGIGVSSLLKYTSGSFYSSNLVLRTNNPPPSDYIEYINRLHTFCKENNRPALMDALSVSEDQAKNIIDISAFWIIDRGADGIADQVDLSNTHNVYDTINIRMQDRLNVGVRIKAPQELSNVRNGIIRYINSDSLFQQRNRIRLRQNQEFQLRITYDLLQLDSLQKIKYFEETHRISQPGNGQMIFLQEQKTQLVYPEIHELFERKQYLDANLTLYKDIVTVLSEFSIPAERVNGLMYYGKNVIPIFFGLAIILLIILANRNKVREIFKKY